MDIAAGCQIHYTCSMPSCPYATCPHCHTISQWHSANCPTR